MLYLILNCALQSVDIDCNLWCFGITILHDYEIEIKSQRPESAAQYLWKKRGCVQFCSFWCDSIRFRSL